nr:MAG TPA: hypothetical protein [Caudoviricetes sp.]
MITTTGSLRRPVVVRITDVVRTVYCTHSSTDVE